MDPRPGFPIDGLVLAVGVLVAVIATFAIGIGPAWRASRADSRDGVSRPSHLTAWLARRRFRSRRHHWRAVRVRARTRTVGSPRPVHARRRGDRGGDRGGHGDVRRQPRPARGHACALRLRLGCDPRLRLPGGRGRHPDGDVIHRSLDANASVRGYSELIYNEIPIDGRAGSVGRFRQVPTPRGADDRRGPRPTAPGEVALAAGTSEELGKGIGDHVTGYLDGRRTAPSTSLSWAGSCCPVWDRARARTTRHSAKAALITAGDTNTLFAPGVSSSITIISPRAGRRSRSAPGRPDGGPLDIPGGDQLNLSPVSRPSDIVALARLRPTPFVLAGLLVLLVSAAVANALFVAVRRRRFDLAVLKTLGETRRQLLATVAWQASSTAIVAVVIGLPVGVVLGRWIWRALADAIGVVADPATPWIALAVLAAVVLVARQRRGPRRPAPVLLAPAPPSSSDRSRTCPP